jgi:hypothetical protein
MSYDFNISNYSIPDLETFLQLTSNYNEFEIQTKEGQIRTKLRIAFQKAGKNTKIEKQAITFLDEAKRILLEKLQKTKLITSGSAYLIDKNKAKDSITSYIEPITSFQTDVAQGNLNRLRKRTTNYTLCMNTMFRECTGSTPSESLFVLPYPLKHIVSTKLVSLELPNTIYLLSDKRRTNRFYIIEYIQTETPDVFTKVEALIIIPEGNYSSEQLETLLPTSINNTLGSGSRFQVIIDSIDGRTTISNTTHNFDLYFRTEDTCQNISKNIGWCLGFRNECYTSCNSYVSESLYNLVPTQYIYFVLNEYTNNNSTTVMGIFSEDYLEKNILAKIPLPVDTYKILYDNNSTLISKKRDYFGPIDIAKFSIKLLDQYGDAVDLNDADYSFTLELEIAYDI